MAATTKSETPVAPRSTDLHSPIQFAQVAQVAAFFESYKVYALLHRSKLKYLRNVTEQFEF